MYVVFRKKKKMYDENMTLENVIKEADDIVFFFSSQKRLKETTKKRGKRVTGGREKEGENVKEQSER